MRSLIQIGGPGLNVEHRSETQVELAEPKPGVFLVDLATSFTSDTGTVARRQGEAGWRRKDMEVISVKLGDIRYPDSLFMPENLPIPKEVQVSDRRDPRVASAGGLPALVARDRVKAGDPAPAFRVETVEGKPLALEDYRGKYVLVDFWATWCGPCLEQTPYLKRTYEAFEDEERFAIIGLSLDAEAEPPRRYAEEHGLKWIQGFLGPASETPVPGEYGVIGIPSIWLIGPDGKVLARDLRGDEISEAVSKALERR